MMAAAPAAGTEALVVEEEVPEPVLVPVELVHVPEWRDIGGGARLQAWAHELRQAVLAGDTSAEAWSLAGTAVMLVGSDMRWSETVIRRVALDAGFHLFRAGYEELPPLASLAQLETQVPAILFIEPGLWMRKPADGEDKELAELIVDIQERVIAWMRAFNPAAPIVLVTATTDLSEELEELREVGLFDRFFTVPAPSAEQYGNQIIDRFGREDCGDSVLSAAAQVGFVFRREFDNERRCALALLTMRRIIHRERRTLEFLDVVKVATAGFTDSDAAADRVNGRYISVHEAGHVVVAIVDSDGENIPDYASIIASPYYAGVVVDSSRYHLNREEQSTYRDTRHQLRTMLAGRAAEELVFGVESISSGAVSDLEQATRLATSSCATHGFVSRMEEGQRSGSCLRVTGLDPATRSSSETAHIEGLVREWLAAEYAVVLRLLQANRNLLDAITERLLAEPVLSQDTLASMAQRFRS